METTEINIALDFDKLEEIYTYFVEKFINIQTELKTIELYTNNNKFIESQLPYRSFTEMASG